MKMITAADLELNKAEVRRGNHLVGGSSEFRVQPFVVAQDVGFHLVHRIALDGILKRLAEAAEVVAFKLCGERSVFFQFKTKSTRKMVINYFIL